MKNTHPHVWYLGGKEFTHSLLNVLVYRGSNGKHIAYGIPNLLRYGRNIMSELLFTKCWNIELKICRLHAKTSVTMPLSSIKDLAVAISTRAEDDPPLYKLGSKPIQAVCKGESGALNWAFLGDVREHLASMPLPLATFFKYFTSVPYRTVHIQWKNRPGTEYHKI